jgi:hypothetical protein
MNDQQLVIDLGTDGSATIERDQAKWLDEKLRRGQRPTREIRVKQDDSDTEGHSALRSATVRVLAEDDDDTEGHAISIHFPSAAEADAFRKRLMVTGVLVGTVALASAGAVGLGAIQSADSAGAGTGSTAATLSGPMDVHEAPAFAAGAAATQAGPMDVHEAPAFQGTDAESGEADGSQSLGGPTPR